MAILAFTNTPLYTLSHHKIFSARASFKPLQLPTSASCSFSGGMGCWKVRGMTVITRAGASANSYIIAFTLPFSLLVLTIVTAWRVGDKLEQDFLEEMAASEAIRQAEEEDYEDFVDFDDSFEEEEEEGEEEGEEAETETEPQPEIAFSRTRNRPRREA